MQVFKPATTADLKVRTTRVKASWTDGFQISGGRMNYARLALAAVAATVFDACYGFLVYGQHRPQAGGYRRSCRVCRVAGYWNDHRPGLQACAEVGAL